MINDGSTDNTMHLLKKNSNLFSKFVDLPRNRGKGLAIIEGLRLVSEGYILIQDADLEYDPIQIPILWDLVTHKKMDLLMTTRLSGALLTRVHYFWHKFGNRLITLIFNIVNNTTFSDIYSGYLIFKRNLVDTNLLVFKQWGQQAEILTFIVKNSDFIYETPITYMGRSYEEGKKIKANSVLPVIIAIFWTKFRCIYNKI